MPHWGTPAQIVEALAVVGFMIVSLYRTRNGPPPAPPPEPTIEFGERFQLWGAEPWPRHPLVRVVVIDVKEGWVRCKFYDRAPTAKFETQYGDERGRWDDFKRRYKPLPPGEI